MTTFTWTPLELFASEGQLVSIRYKLAGDDGQNVVESEGNLTLDPNIANKPLANIVESDLVQWLDQSTTIDGVNLIKSNIEDQLMSLKLAETLAITKVEFPWLAGTFTIA